MKYTNLLSPIKIGNLELKNRIVLPAMVIWKSDKSGMVTKSHLDHYKESSGCGLSIVEAAVVSPEGRLSDKQLGIFNDQQIKGLSGIAEVIHQNGGAAGIQLHHAGGKATTRTTFGETPLVVSKEAVSQSKICRELSTDDISRIINDFTKGARRAVEAGFDYIEFHGAHGYLGTQFLSPLLNKRNDKYGGTLENRQRFLLESFENISAEVKGQAVVSCRLGVADKKPGGISIEDGIDTACRLEEAGMQILNISCGNGYPDSVKPTGSSFKGLYHLAEQIKKHVSIPVIGVGGLVTPEQAELALENNMSDLTAVGKAFLADPGWAQKVLEGRVDEINYCRQCNVCHQFSNPVRCPVWMEYR